MSRKKRYVGIVGHSKDGGPIMSGLDVFNFMDRDGIPFQVVDDKLRDEGWGFNLPEFIDTAVQRKWSIKRIKTFIEFELTSEDAKKLALTYLKYKHE